MTTLTMSIEIDTGGAAFSDIPADLATLLRDLATRVEASEDAGLIRDGNGNRVGQFLISGTDGKCIYCGKSVTYNPLHPVDGDVTDTDGLPDCWDAPRRDCQECGSNGENDPGCPECDDTGNSWMGIHELREGE